MGQTIGGDAGESREGVTIQNAENYDNTFGNVAFSSATGNLTLSTALVKESIPAQVPINDNNTRSKKTDEESFREVTLRFLHTINTTVKFIRIL